MNAVSVVEKIRIIAFPARYLRGSQKILFMVSFNIEFHVPECPAPGPPKKEGRNPLAFASAAHGRPGVRIPISFPVGAKDENHISGAFLFTILFSVSLILRIQNIKP
jgi:hypothetical protein